MEKAGNVRKGGHRGLELGRNDGNEVGLPASQFELVGDRADREREPEDQNSGQKEKGIKEDTPPGREKGFDEASIRREEFDRERRYATGPTRTRGGGGVLEGASRTADLTGRSTQSATDPFRGGLVLQDGNEARFQCVGVEE